MYEYEVDFYEDGEIKTECGIVSSESIINAVANLIDRFPQDCIENLSISFLRSELVLPYTEEAGKSLKKYFVGE